MENLTSPDYHHVTLLVSGVREGLTARGGQQLIKAVVTVKLTSPMALEIVEMLQRYLADHIDGADMITLTLDGEFT